MVSVKPSATSVLGFGPGHVAHYRGARLDIAQCVPVNATYRETSYCYEVSTVMYLIIVYSPKRSC